MSPPHPIPGTRSVATNFFGASALLLAFIVGAIVGGCTRPTDPAASARLAAEGLAAWNAADLDGAAERFQAAVDADPANRHALFGLGAARLRLGQSAAAAAAFADYLALAPRDPAALAGLGLAQIREGKPKDGIENLHRAREIGNTTEFIELHRRAQAGERTVDDFPEAIPRRVALIDPDARRREIVRLQLRGLALVRDGAYRDAEHEYEEAVRLDPTDPVSQLGLGATALRGSQVLERSRSGIERYRVLEPDTAVGEFLIAAQLRGEGLYDNVESIVAHLRRAEELAPDDQDTVYLLADALKNQESIPDTASDLGSLAKFERSLELNRFCPSTHEQLKLAYGLRGDTAKSEFHLRAHEELTRDEVMETRFPARRGDNPWTPLIEDRLAHIDRDGIEIDDDAPLRPRLVSFETTLAAGASALAALDLDGDCDLDLLVAGAGVLRNEGEGRFAAASATGHGDLDSALSAGATEVHVVDFDDDGTSDVLLVADEGLKLLLGAADGAFRDVTAEVRLDGVRALSAVPFDYDHEGDVDLVVIVQTDAGRATRMLRNNLPPRIPIKAWQTVPIEAPTLTFTDVTDEAGCAAAGSSPIAEFGDVENGNDTDLVVLDADGAGRLFTNIRNGMFEEIGAPTGVAPLRATALALEDFDGDGWLDLALVAPDGAVLLAPNRGDGTFEPPVGLVGGAGAAIDLEAFDLDNDGDLDLALATASGVRVLRNESAYGAAAPRFVDATADARLAPGKAVARVLALDADEDGDDDLLALHQDGELNLVLNDGGNRNGRLRLVLQGDLSNRLGIGAKVEVADGAFYAKREVRRLPVTIGVGARRTLESVYVLWTNGVRQPYLDARLDDPSWTKEWNRNPAAVGKKGAEIEPRCGGYVVRQLIRQEGSCPLLYSWDGERFVYVTDALCSAVLGLDIGGGRRAIPNPDDAVTVRGDQLRPAGDGRHRFAFTEELRELTYLDRVSLVAVDHAADVEVFTSNEFTFPPFPEFTIHRARTSAMRPIRAALDDRGDDVTDRLAAVDRRYVDTFEKAPPPMQGMAEMHSLVLDLGDPATLAAAGSIRLLLDGWFYWTNSSVNEALAQDDSGAFVFTPPMLEVADGAGGWIARGMAGIPAGDHKRVVVDLTGAFPADDYRVRITTNLQVYWDRAQVALDDDPSSIQVETRELAPVLAELRHRGYSEQVYPDGAEPNDYDYQRATVDGSTYGTYYDRFQGRLTRFGDVLPLLLDTDDRFAILHHGEEIRLEFDALPPPREGMARTFVFRSFGWAKDMDHNTGAATTIEPLPFRGMSTYPPPDGEQVADVEARREYVATWNTRVNPPPAPRLGPRVPLPPEASGTGARLAFTDVTAGAGVRFHHAEGRVLVNLEETMGSGCAFGDVDGDGDDDLFLVAGSGPDHGRSYGGLHHHVLLRNRGDGTFDDVTAQSGVGLTGSGMAALFADLDGDGDQDLVVTQIGSNLLFRNRGDGTFEDVTFGSGLAGAGYHSGVAAGDYDRDGDLDLYVGRYVEIDPANRPTEAGGFGRGFVRDDPPSILPMAYAPAPNTLWRNDGGLRFTDVTEEAGVADPDGRTLGVLFADFDLDGWLDLYCANDVSPNDFFRNQGDGTFESLAWDVGLDDPRGGMGVALADVDDDTDLDLAVTYWQLEPNALYRNNVIHRDEKRSRIPTFEDIGYKVGLGQPSVGRVGWGVSVSDFDNDGHLDAFVVNGYTSPDYETTTLCLAQPPSFFLGDAAGGFEEVRDTSAGGFVSEAWNARGLATADWDLDGDLDVCVTQNNGDAILLRNDGGSRRRWLQVALRGDGASVPVDPAGARVTVEVGGRKLTRVLLLGSSYLCGESKVLHFGLGDAAAVDAIVVRWPDGMETRHAGGAVDRRLVIAR